MALGELTKQLAQQALLSATTKEPAPAAAPVEGEPASATFFAQLQAMQKALKEDEELVVLFQHGAEKMRVFEIFAPSRNVVVLSGPDADRNPTRVLAAIDSLQLICKVGKVAPGAKAARLNLVTARPKGSSA
jgi:hypothetical protein